MAKQPTSQQTAAPDALELLKADHDKVRGLFREFDSLSSDEDDEQRKAELVDEICYELTIHSMIEEEIFYPLVRAAIKDDDLMDEADVEHAGARDLISQLEVMYPGDDHFDATVTVLGEEIMHHIDKEENDMSPLRVRPASTSTNSVNSWRRARTNSMKTCPRLPPRWTAWTPAWTRTMERANHHGRPAKGGT